MKYILFHYAVIGLLSGFQFDVFAFKLEQHDVSRGYDIYGPAWPLKQHDPYTEISRNPQRLDSRFAQRYLQKRVFIAGAENGPKELGLESPDIDPLKSQEDKKKMNDYLGKLRENKKGLDWKKVDGKWKAPEGAIKNGPSREETIKELPGLVPGTKGSDRFEQAWKDSGPGKLVTDGGKQSYQKSMPGPDAMSDQALNNYSKKMYEAGNKEAKELGATAHSNMAAALFAQKPVKTDWMTTSRGKIKKDANGKEIPSGESNVHKDTKSPVHMSLSSKGPGMPRLSHENQLAVDHSSELQRQQRVKEKDAKAQKTGDARQKERWGSKQEPQKVVETKSDKDIKRMEEEKRKPKVEGKPEKIPPKKVDQKCDHTTGGNCAEKNTLSKAPKDSNGHPAPGSVSAAYGQAVARPGFKPDLMKNGPPSAQPGQLGAHPGCSGKSPKIGCDKVLEHNKVKDANGRSPGTQDAKFSIPALNTGVKAKQLMDKLPGNPEFKKLPTHKTDQNGKPIEHRVPKGATDKNGNPKKPDEWELPPKKMTEQDKSKDQDARTKKDQAKSKTIELAQAREKAQKPPVPQTPEKKEADAKRIVDEWKQAKAKSPSKILGDHQVKVEPAPKNDKGKTKQSPASNGSAGKENAQTAGKQAKPKEQPQSPKSKAPPPPPPPPPPPKPKAAAPVVAAKPKELPKEQPKPSQNPVKAAAPVTPAKPKEQPKQSPSPAKAAAPVAQAKPKEQPKPITSSKKKLRRRDVLEPSIEFTNDGSSSTVVESGPELDVLRSFIMVKMKRFLLAEANDLLDEYVWS